MSAQVFWIGNAAAVSQAVAVTITAVATGGIVSVTINGKTISYTCLVSDSTTTAAAALQALLAASTFPEFLESTWTQSGNVITATAATPGTPIYSSSEGWGISASGSGGATAFVSQLTPNSSPNDVANPLNWLRNGVNAIPQTGDFIVIADSDDDLLWNLDQLAVPASYTRWQSFSATIGLPENNPAGYFEFRPTYLSFGASSSSSSSSSGPASPIVAIIGQGTIGSGPTRERYNFGANQVKWVIRAAGSPQDDYAVRILGTNPLTTLQITSVSVGVAMLPGESAVIQSAVVDGGGSLDLGPNVTVGTTLNLFGATANIFCLIPTIFLQQSSQLQCLSTQLQYATITCITGSTIVWNSDSNITTLAVQNGSNVDLSQDVRPFTVTTLTIDADTCQVNDPNNRIVITNAVTMNQRVSAGPFVFGSGRSFKIT